MPLQHTKFHRPQTTGHVGSTNPAAAETPPPPNGARTFLSAQESLPANPPLPRRSRLPFHVNRLGVMGTILKERAALVLVERPPLGVLANGNERPVGGLRSAQGSLNDFLPFFGVRNGAQ